MKNIFYKNNTSIKLKYYIFTLFFSCVILNNSSAQEKGIQNSYYEMGMNILTGEANLSASGEYFTYAIARTGIRSVLLAKTSNPTDSIDIGKKLGATIAFVNWMQKNDHALIMILPNGRPPEFKVYNASTGEAKNVEGSSNKNPVMINNTASNGYASPIIVLADQRNNKNENFCQISLISERCEPIKSNGQELELIEFGWTQVSLHHQVDAKNKREIWNTEIGKNKVSVSTPLEFDDPYSKHELVSVQAENGEMVTQEINSAGYLSLVSTSSQEVKEISKQTNADVVNVLLNAKSNSIDAFVSEDLKPNWHLLNKNLTNTFQILENSHNGFPWIMGRSQNERIWLIKYESESSPNKLFILDRKKKKLTQLKLGELEDHSSIESIVASQVQTKDGIRIPVYLTLPNKTLCPTDGCPLVVEIHGGPNAQDRFSYSIEKNWYAAKGMAVLSVNFRGSTGNGINFMRAIEKEWGGKPIDDINQALNWAKNQPEVNQHKIAIVGESYGGFAALLLATKIPDTVSCVAAKSAISDLSEYVQYAIDEKKPWSQSLINGAGDPSSSEDKIRMLEQSIGDKHQILNSKILITHGQKDETTPILNIEKLVYQLRPRQANFSFMVFPNEGHKFSYDAQALYRFVLGDFLSSCLKSSNNEPTSQLLSTIRLDIRDGANRIPIFNSLCGDSSYSPFGLTKISECSNR